MGLFFSNTSPKNVFRTSKEVRRALAEISSLTKEEKKLIFDEIVKELDDGGVTVYEGKKNLIIFFYGYKNDGRISSVDYEI